MVGIRETCKRLEKTLPLTNAEVFAGFNMTDNPWRQNATDAANFYACLHGLIVLEKPKRILEIGTKYGLSAAAMSLVAPVVSVDLVEYESRVESPNITYIIADTQTNEPGNKNGIVSDAPVWFRNKKLLWIVLDGQWNDVLFIDGKHSSNGLFNDLWVFWPSVSPGGLVVCDDLFDPMGNWPRPIKWLGDTWQSFYRFTAMIESQIAERYVWDFPYVTSGPRPWGLIRKAV